MQKIMIGEKHSWKDDNSESKGEDYKNSESKHIQITHQINAAKSIDRLLKLLCDYLESIGLNHMTYHIFPGFGAVEESDSTRFYTHNIPQSIIDTYLTIYKDKHDPMIALVYKLGKLFRLSDALSLQIAANEPAAITTQATYDLFGEGLCIPLFGPNFLRGYLFTATGAHDLGIPADVEWHAHHVATVFHNRYAVLQNRLQREVKLTSRELQTLELVVMGRKNSDIAIALGISPHTVDSYLRRIYLKLGTTDRVTTSIRALQFNLLQKKG